jgi:predicted nucleotidyltransferase
MNRDLQALAETLAQWIDAAPGIPRIYLFGSRVRGDYTANSDVDVRLFPADLSSKACAVTVDWWMKQNETDFAELKAQLWPARLHIHRENQDDADPHIWKGMENPVLVVRKVVCVWTPRVKPS